MFDGVLNVPAAGTMWVTGQTQVVQVLLLFRAARILGVLCALVESCEGITGKKAVLSS